MNSGMNRTRLSMAVNLIMAEDKGEDPYKALRALCNLIGSVGRDYPDHEGVQAIVAMTYQIVAGIED